ncbi:hypothetical protein SDC9_199191 [bioreactor metagenome]|uniref:Uncharacterized protein n=1 Tax=bioreactor metagenome TaxID=1076179 RepID=A0A645IWH5_9ZZZZ
MDIADAHGQGVHARFGKKAQRLPGVGVRNGGCRLILPAAYPADFGFHIHGLSVGHGHYLPGEAHVFRKGQVRAVKHDGGEAQPDGFFHTVHGQAVVQMDRHLHLGTPGGLQHGRPDHVQGRCLKPGLGNLQDDRRLGLFRRRQNPKDHFKVCHAESACGAVVMPCPFKQRAHTR